MNIITASTKTKTYPVYIGENLINDAAIFKPHLTNNRVIIVSSELIAKLHLDRLRNTLAGYSVETILIDAGEQHKNLASIEKIIDFLAQQQHDRFSTLISLGGGVIGDLTGFAASVFMRGLNLIHVPTTLLAQVDSCIGGKTGFNHLGIKNLIGTFYQPTAVIVDSAFLKTLPDREYLAGLAEVLKYGMACDAEFFCWLEEQATALKGKDPKILQMAIQRCCEIKLQIVYEDETDHAHRAVLNFGHTFAHALESATNFAHYLHGEAVAIGMLHATWLGVKLELIPQVLWDRLARLLQILGLPSKYDQKLCSTFMLYSYILNDKKKNSRQLSLILPCELGKVKVFKDFDRQYLERLMEEYAIS